MTTTTDYGTWANRCRDTDSVEFWPIVERHELPEATS